jgi:hypothetical protein
MTTDVKLKTAIDMAMRIVEQRGAGGDTKQHLVQDFFEFITDEIDVVGLHDKNCPEFIAHVADITKYLTQPIGAMTEDELIAAERGMADALDCPPTLTKIAIIVNLARVVIQKAGKIDITFGRPCDTVFYEDEKLLHNNGWMKFYRAYGDLILAG